MTIELSEILIKCNSVKTKHYNRYCCYTLLWCVFNMITKDEVLKAFDIIEKYQEQQKKIIQELEVKEDPRSILILGLNTREINCLKAAGIETIGELLAVDRFELRKYRNLGKKGIIDINKKLKEFGINTPEFLTW